MLNLGILYGKYVNVWFWNKIFKNKPFLFVQPLNNTPFSIVERAIRGDK